MTKSSEAKALKSNPRERLGVLPESFAPEIERASRPFKRTREKSGPSPRIEMRRPSPLSRSIETPGRRCRDSARLASGNLPMSSALMVSCMSLARRLVSSALATEAR